jgi:hypothetical protein
LHLGHFISIFPVVGVIISKRRLPHLPQMHKPAVRLLNHRGGSAQLARFRRSFWGGIFTLQIRKKGIRIASRLAS